MRRVTTFTRKHPAVAIAVAFTLGMFLMADGGRMFTALLSLAIVLAIPAIPVIIGIYLYRRYRAAQAASVHTQPNGVAPEPGQDYPPAQPQS